MNINVNDPSVSQWTPHVIAATSATMIPWQFGRAWLAIESGGNVAAVGNRRLQVLPGAAPREIGLFQIYNPDDFKALGVDPLELVAYCVRPARGTPNPNPKEPNTLIGPINPQKLARPMTAAEIRRHVDLGVKMIAQKRRYADHYMTASGVTWPTSGPDYWRMVKLPHALPSIVNTGLGQVTRKLGHPPRTWAEFRVTYEQINPRAKYSPEKAARKEDQDGYYRALANAEWTGGQVPAGWANT